MHSLPDGVAAALPNLLLNLVLVQLAGEALGRQDGTDQVLPVSARFCENRAALVLGEDELDRVPE